MKTLCATILTCLAFAACGSEGDFRTDAEVEAEFAAAEFEATYALLKTRHDKD